MLLALVMICIAFGLLGCWSAYWIGRGDGFRKGYEAGRPKTGEAAQLRDQVKRLQIALETQCACACTAPTKAPDAPWQAPRDPVTRPDGSSYVDLYTPDGVMRVDVATRSAPEGVIHVHIDTSPAP